MSKGVLASIVLAGMTCAQNVPELRSPDHPGCDGQVYAVGGRVKAPQITSRTLPIYSKEALRARIEGSVIVLAAVDATGRMCSLRIERALEPGLDQAASASVRQWRFKPGLKDGTPVAVQVHIEVEFSLP